MKKLFALMAGIALVASAAQADLIAYWNFNGLSIATSSAPGSGGVPLSINADAGVGSGVLSLGDWTGLVDDFGGTTGNALFGDPAEESLSLVGELGNGSWIDLQFSMAGYQDLEISFDTRGTGTGFNSGLWSWSTDGATFTGFGIDTANTTATWLLRELSLNDLDNAGTAYLRYTLDGASSGAGNNRIDNLQLNATLIPEPGTLGLMALGLLGVAYRRRR